MKYQQVRYYKDPFTLSNGIIIRFEAGYFSYIRNHKLATVQYNTEKEAIYALNKENIDKAKYGIHSEIEKVRFCDRFFPCTAVPFPYHYQSFFVPEFENEFAKQFSNGDYVFLLFVDENNHFHPYIGLLDQPFMQNGEALAICEVTVWLDNFDHSTDIFLVELRQVQKAFSIREVLNAYIDLSIDMKNEQWFSYLAQMRNHLFF